MSRGMLAGAAHQGVADQWGAAAGQQVHHKGGGRGGVIVSMLAGHPRGGERGNVGRCSPSWRCRSAGTRGRHVS
jgi:hypothetical protein